MVEQVAQAKVASQDRRENLPLSPDIEAEIERLGNSDPYIETQREIEFYAWLNDQRDSQICGRVMADKGTSLSRVCQHYRMQHIRQRGGVQQIPVSVVYIETPPSCTTRLLLIAILEALNVPLKGGPLKDLRSRVRGNIKGYGVKLLIIDDADQLKLGALVEAAKLFEVLRIPIILAGTYHLDNLIQQKGYECVYNSFLHFCEFKPLTKAQMKPVVEAWVTNTLNTPLWSDVSELLNDSTVSLLYKRTQGLREPLYEILRKTAILALRKQQCKIDHAVLHEVLKGCSIPRVTSRNLASV